MSGRSLKVAPESQSMPSSIQIEELYNAYARVAQSEERGTFTIDVIPRSRVRAPPRAINVFGFWFLGVWYDTLVMLLLG